MSDATSAGLVARFGPGIVRFVLLECVTGRSSKAYLVVVALDADVPGAYRCHAAWGKIGGPSRSQRKQSGGLALCERQLEQLVREKRQRGYRVVRDERPDATAEAPTTPAAVPAAAPPEENLAVLLDRRRREAAWVI